MPLDLALFATILTTTAAAVLLGSAFYLMRRLRTSGGMERSLARVIVDARARRVYMWSMGAFSATFLGLGVLAFADSMTWIPADLAPLAYSIVFGVGSCCLLVLMANGLRVTPLSLGEEIELRDLSTPVLAAVERAESQVASSAADTMYVAPPLA